MVVISSLSCSENARSEGFFKKRYGIHFAVRCHAKKSSREECGEVANFSTHGKCHRCGAQASSMKRELIVSKR